MLENADAIDSLVHSTQTGKTKYIELAYDDDDESKSYVRPLLQLETVTSVLVICSDKQFGFQITTERGCKSAAA